MKSGAGQTSATTYPRESLPITVQAVLFLVSNFVHRQVPGDDPGLRRTPRRGPFSGTRSSTRRGVRRIETEGQSVARPQRRAIPPQGLDCVGGGGALTW